MTVGNEIASSCYDFRSLLGCLVRHLPVVSCLRIILIPVVANVDTSPQAFLGTSDFLSIKVCADHAAISARLSVY